MIWNESPDPFFYDYMKETLDEALPRVVKNKIKPTRK
jgi:hypothetical protein